MSESKLPALVEAMAATELIAVCERHGIHPAYVRTSKPAQLTIVPSKKEHSNE